MHLNEKERAAYMAGHGWPVTIAGKPKTVPELDRGELMQIARRYAAILITDMSEITSHKAERK